MTSQNSSGPGVIKLNPSGSALVYATYLSGSPAVSSENRFDFPLGIAVDAAGDAYVAGFTSSPDFPVTPGAFQTAFPGPWSGFLTKLNPQGTGLVYSTFLGPSEGYGPWIVKVDAQGGAWVLGQGYYTTNGAFLSGPNQSLLAHLSADGSAEPFSTVLPSANPLDQDSLGNVYVAGCVGTGGYPCPENSSSTSIPTGAAAFQTTYGGNGDGYAARFNSSGILTGATYLGGSQFDTANLIAVAPNGSVVIAGTTASPDFPEINLGQEAQAGFVISMFMDLTVQNAATFTPGVVSPGEIVAIRGYGLGPVAGVTQTVSTPSACAAASVLCFDIYAAPILYQQYEQVNAQVPWEIAGQTSTNVFLKGQGGIFITSAPSPGPFYGVPIASAVPGVFYVNNSDGTTNSPANPANPGDIIAVYGTGAGVMSPRERRSASGH